MEVKKMKDMKIRNNKSAVIFAVLLLLLGSSMVSLEEPVQAEAIPIPSNFIGTAEVTVGKDVFKYKVGIILSEASNHANPFHLYIFTDPAQFDAQGALCVESYEFQHGRMWDLTASEPENGTVKGTLISNPALPMILNYINLVMPDFSFYIVNPYRFEVGATITGSISSNHVFLQIEGQLQYGGFGVFTPFTAKITSGSVPPPLQLQ